MEYMWVFIVVPLVALAVRFWKRLGIFSSRKRTDSLVDDRTHSEKMAELHALRSDLADSTRDEEE